MVIPDFFSYYLSAHTHGTNLFGKQISRQHEMNSGLENGQMQIMHFRGNKWVFYYICSSYPDTYPYKAQLQPACNTICLQSICNLFFSDELRKFAISDFPKQTHFGDILITSFYFLHPLIDPHFDIVFQPMASTKTFW